MDLTLIILLIAVIIVVFIIGTYFSDASTLIGTASGDANLKNSYNYSTWGYYVTWGLIVVAILAALIAIIYGSEYGIGEYFLVFVILVLILALGGLAIASAEQLSMSTSFGTSPPAPLQTAYDDFGTALGLSAGTFIVVVVLLIAGLLYSNYATQDEYRRKYEKLLRSK